MAKSVVLWVCLCAVITNKTSAQAGTLGFYLNGVAYPNGSTVLRSDLGEGNSALQCTTNSTTCCSDLPPEMRAGEFYMPDGSLVITMGSTTNGYYRTRGSSHIALNRQPTGTITGQFRCEIPDASQTFVGLFINIVDIGIIPLGGNIAGEIYRLECSISMIGGSNYQPVFTWLDPLNNPVPSEMINATNSVSTLVFSPLAASHAGTYTCVVSLEGVSYNETIMITVNNPHITIRVDGDRVPPIVGSVYSLTCAITGAERLTNSNVTYQWFRSGEVVPGQTMETLPFSSLSISDAGDYSCAITLSSYLLSGPISRNSDPFTLMLSPFFNLNGVAYPNGSTVLRSDIGEGDNALQCTTDSTTCCRFLPPEMRAGEFYMPDGGLVLIMGSTTNGYYRTRGSGHIALNRQPTGTITGQFRCEIPDASQTLVDLFINIVAVSIIPLDANTAGEIYRLECSITMIGGSNYQPVFTWLDPLNNPVPSEMINATNSVSTLVFSPLAASHAGTYTCVVSLEGVSYNETIMITVNNPIITIRVDGDRVPPIVGSVYSLTCAITGAERLTNSNVTYQWFRSGEVVPGQTMETLPFSSLSISDAGNYSCAIILSSYLLSGPISRNSDPFALMLSLPSPTVVITSSPVSPIRPVGSNVILTCSVELSPLLDVPVTVTAQISGPSGVTITPLTNSVMESTGRYTSTGMISSFVRDQSGEYTCRATVVLVTANPLIIGSSGVNGITIGTGVYLSLRGTVYANNSVIRVTEIGETNPDTDLNEGLQCVTDRLPCCRTAFRAGEWYLYSRTGANRTVVPGPLDVVGFYRNRGYDDGTVNLNRLSGVVMPIGQFCCEVPDIAGNNQSLCAYIDFPAQLVDPITAEGISTAGFSSYTLVCNTARESALQPSTTLAVQWLDPMGNVISSGANFSISGSGPTNDSFLTSRLTFSILYTSQAGEYTCRILQTIPGTVTNHTEDVSFTVIVKLPSLTMPLTLRRSHNGVLYAGTFFSLSCIVTLNTTGVDSNFTLQSSVSIPRSTDTERVNISPPAFTGSAYEITVTFSPLIEDDTGIYNCSAMVVPFTQQNLITASDLSFVSESINVGPLQSPIVAVLGALIQTAGNQHTLTCSATVNAYLIVTPTIEWNLPGDPGDSFITIGEQSTSGAVSTKTLLFAPLRTSHGGVYQCTATINITGFDLQSRTLSRTFRVQVPAPLVTILGESSTPYNGTNFTLTSMIEVDENVDTAVVLSAVWSGNGGSQETLSPPYLTSLVFEPLTPNGSNMYTLSVTIRPSGSSAFILSNTGTATHNLIVQSLPSRPPTVTVVSRGPSPIDGCGEGTTLRCTANQVENLFRSPTLSWIAPDGREIPTGEGSNPRVDAQTKQLIFSGITTTNTGSYSCRATISIPEAQIVNHFDEATVIASNSVPGMVENLACSRSSPSELTFTWQSPMNMLQDSILEYQVEVNGLRNREGTRDVVQFDVTGFNTGSRAATINQGLTAEVPYNITVKAVNLAGCGKEQQLYCFIQEGVPPQPSNVVVVRFDSTSVGVSWTEFTLVELKGLANYTVTYDIVIESRKRQLGGMITVPWTQNQVIISSLQPGAEYQITVRISTATGTSAPVTVFTGSGSLPPSTTVPPPGSESDSTGAIVGGVVAVMIVLIITTAATIVVVVFILRNHKLAEFKPSVSQVPTPYEQPRVLLSDISKVENESKNTDSEPGYAGYEMLDKYDRAYEEIKVVQPPKLPDRQELPSPRPPSSASDYVITQCPAYIPAAHGNQQGQEAETPLMQPAGTTAPKDSSVTVEDDETYWNVSAS